MSHPVVELLEYQPRLLPANALSEDVAKMLWQNYRDQLDLEFPDFRTNNQWRLTSLGLRRFYSRLR